jgi:hypothetical protein
MNHPEGNWGSPRPQKNEFIPTEDLSAEHDISGLYQGSALNPEDEMIAKEEGFFEETEWPAWVLRHMEQNDGPELLDADELDEEYWNRLSEFEKQFGTHEERHEDLAELLERFHLPPQMAITDIKNLITRKQRSYGVRGKEPKNKHERRA